MSNGVGLVFVEKRNKKYLIKKPIKTELNNFFIIKAQFNICLFKKLETSLGFLVFNVKLLILIDLNQFGLNYFLVRSNYNFKK